MDRAFDIDAAIVLAATAHAGQRDKGRPALPYITHPLRVMAAFDDPELQQIAVLHDVVEDTAVTLHDLIGAGASPRVVAAVDLLTGGGGGRSPWPASPSSWSSSPFPARPGRWTAISSRSGS